MPSKDPTIALLTEIRDLLKAEQQATMKTKQAAQRSLWLKIVLNGGIVIFVAFASYYYYHTLVTSFGT